MTPQRNQSLRDQMRASLRLAANQAILRAAPEHDQRNAALGVLSETEAQAVRDAITPIRNAYHAKMSEIDAILASAQTDREKYRALRAVDLRLDA